MKKFIQPLAILFLSALVPLTQAQTTYTLNPLGTFGANGDGSIRPGQSIGASPRTGNDVQISAPGGFGIQPGDISVSTNGFNMRGLSQDPVSGNLLFVDTHAGSSGAAPTNVPNEAVYVLDRDSGQIIGELSTNGITALPSGGVGTIVTVGVADDGVVYGCQQINATSSGFKIYRWNTADTNNANFGQAPVVAFTNVLLPSERMAQTMAVRGAGTNTQILVSSASTGGTGTNIYLFDTTDGTNFAPHRIFFSFSSLFFNDGIAFGPTNTFWTKRVGAPLLYLAWDAVNYTNASSQGTIIASYSGSSANDPLLNISAIAVDNTTHLLAGMEEIGGVATGGNGKLWLYDIPNPTNHAPAILATRVYPVNFQKTTAPMGYMVLRNGRLYATASNNGFLVSTVDSTIMSAPSYTWTDFGLDGAPYTRNSDLPVNTRASEGNTAHFEVFAVPDVTNYQWFSNNVLIAGANNYFLDVPNTTTNMSGTVYRAVAYNAAGSANSISSTLTVVSTASFFHPKLLWSVPANASLLTNPTNFITSGGGSGTPNERCIAYNALSNQLLVVRGSSLANLKIMVVDADRGTNGYSYVLKTNGILPSVQITLVGIGVADDGAVYAAGVSSTATTDFSFRVYRWADTGPNTLPATIFGTNSPAANGNPSGDVDSRTFRYGDNLAVHGSGTGTEIIVDPQNTTKFAGILKPTDSTMTNWTQTGYLLQNIQGSYGSGAYGTTIGRSLQFGPVMNSPLGPLPTFWQKRYNGVAGSPLAGMAYGPGGGIAPLAAGNIANRLFTNGPVAINFTLHLCAGMNLVGGTANLPAAQSTLDLFDVTDPSQAAYLSSQNLTFSTNGTHFQNGNAIAQVIFGANPNTGTNYIFAIEGNNGVSAYVLEGGVTPAPQVLTQPRNLRLLEGSSGSMSVSIDQNANIQWYKGTNPPVSTGTSGTTLSFNNANTNMAGLYFAIATNVNGAATSGVAQVTVALTNDAYSLSQVWAANPSNNTSYPYVTPDGGANTPNERAFAYNGRSNQLIVVRCPPASTAYTVHVVDATTGVKLYNLNTTGVTDEGTSEVTGSNPIDLVAAGASDDGNIYICNESPNASGGNLNDPLKMFRVYRWTNSDPATPPVLVFLGDPASLSGVNRRWGDAMAVRGSGTNTEIVLNDHEGDFAAVLKPTDNSLNSFTNYWFADTSGSGSIGRSLQFGTNITILEKRKGTILFMSSYDTNAHTASAILTSDSTSTLGGVAADAARSLVVGVDFVGSTTSPQKPDAVALYDISDPNSPMLVRRYNFPNNQVANGNFICQTVIVTNRVYALDANNGMMMLSIVPAVNSMKLTITPAGANVNLSWGNPGAVLQSATDLASPNWTDIAGPGVTSSSQPASSTCVFYRLIQRP